MAKIYRTIARIVPKFAKKKIKSFLIYSNLLVDHEIFIGFVTIISLLLGISLGFFVGTIFKLPFWIPFIAVTVLTNLIVYFWLLFMVDKKARVIEESLPDALQLMTSNLRAGMTPEKALLLSARPEFGPLKTEIDIVGKKVALGKSIAHALTEMAARVRSKRLERAVELITSGLQSGGNLANLLDTTSNTLREQYLVDKKIKAGVTMYVMFIFSIAAFISPIVLGLISFLVEVLQASFSSVDIPDGIGSLPINIGQVSISPEFLVAFLISFIIINAFMASLLLGLISKGKQRQGIKYFIPMSVIAIPLFFIVRISIRNLFGGLFGL